MKNEKRILLIARIITITIIVFIVLFILKQNYFFNKYKNSTNWDATFSEEIYKGKEVNLFYLNLRNDSSDTSVIMYLQKKSLLNNYNVYLPICETLADAKEAFDYYIHKLNNKNNIFLTNNENNILLYDLINQIPKDNDFYDDIIVSYIYDNEIINAAENSTTPLKYEDGKYDSNCFVKIPLETRNNFLQEEFKNILPKRIKQYNIIKEYKEVSKNEENTNDNSLSDIDSYNEVNLYLRLAPNVDQKYLNAQYWINKIPNPDDILMGDGEIESRNFNRKEKEAHKDINFFSIEKDNTEKKLTTEQLKKLMSFFNYDENKSYYVMGEKKNKEYFDMLNSKFNIEEYENKHLRYGFSIAKTDLKNIPSSDKVFTNPNNVFTDEFLSTSMILNEPIIIIAEDKDGDWYYVITQYGGGWVEKEKVAFAENKEAWLFLKNYENFVVVVNNKVHYNYTPYSATPSFVDLTMGVKLPVLQYRDDDYIKELQLKTISTMSNIERVPFNNFKVLIPIREEDGLLSYKEIYMPYSEGLHFGYLPYTRKNELELLFKSLGDNYGWGGSYDARDCSSYIMEAYRCFGLELARTTSTQKLMNFDTIDLTDMSNDRKKSILDIMPAGVELIFSGHAMIYLGKDNNEYFVISQMGSTNISNNLEYNVIPIYSVSINDLNVHRQNKNSWLDSIDTIQLLQ
ncbi:MAG: NlpC/P60 family protein [Eubacteriales bacterium]|nr:NlpC/P60 family protein [Eubacteriales bacterium]